MPVTRTPRPFHVARAGDGTTVRFPAGAALTEAAVEALAGRLSDLLAEGGHARLTLDLSGVVVLDSAALGKLLGLDRAVRAVGGRLVLADPTPNVRRLFRLTRLDTVLDIRAADARSG
jgi:anti-sigma B factor antagonist